MEAVAPWDVHRVGVLFDHGHDVEHLEEPFEGDEGRHDVEVQVRELGERLVEAGEVAGQGDDGSHVEGAVHRGHAAHPVRRSPWPGRRSG